MTPALRRALQTLHEVFGLRSLRPGQSEVIERVLAGRSTLAIMPTGAGKSLCYQLPALSLEGRTLVVSPLIALMKDQCEKLRAQGVAAVQLNSQVDTEEMHAAERAVADGSARIVLVTPERLADPDFLALLQGHPTSLLVVDEAHCISQWGHDFRPAFLEIGPVAARLGKPCVLALTATANEAVAADIMSRLGIPRAGLVDTGTFRPNLHYAAEQLATEDEKRERLRTLVNETEGSGIVYTATVKAAEQVHALLLDAGVSAGLYHGKRGASERRQAQDAFMSGEQRVMVATNAFGMGIDKPDIRFVLHYQMPAGLDAYYQESGRAGRDGEAARCTLLFLQKDKAVQQFFLAGRYPSNKDLDSLYGALQGDPPEPAGWTLVTLQERLEAARGKVQVGLALLRQHRIAKQDREGRIALLRPAVDAATLAALLAGYREKRENDQAMLEGMVAYAQSGRCRWQVLLAHLEQAADIERCRTCDNCLRMARLQADNATSPRAAEAGATPEAKPATPVFSLQQAVRVRRYGRGRVLQSDAEAITIEFADGSRRSFHPDFVMPARGTPVA